MAHCMPVLVRPSSLWMWGAAMDTIVWSMKVIETAKIIAARTRLLDRAVISPFIPELLSCAVRTV